MGDDGLDPVLHQPVRMRIMAALYRNRQLTFPVLRDGLGLTPGNLGSHVERLEQVGYVVSARVLAGLHFEVRYRITPQGSDAFRAYVRRLSDLVQELDVDAPPDVP